MARLSNVEADAEPEGSEEQSVSAEGAMDSDSASVNGGEGGTMEEASTPKRRRVNAVTRHSNGNESRSSPRDAMGQAESRETLKMRNAALHRAGQEARQPRGKLPRRSDGTSHALSSHRRPTGNPLSNARTIDVPVDDEDEVLPGKVRRTPIRRTAPRDQNAWLESPTQALLNQQLGNAVEEEDGNEEQDGGDVEAEDNVQDETVVEQPQQSGSGQERRGRPPKQPQPDDTGKRRPGRPPKQPQLDDNVKRNPGRPPKRKSTDRHSPGQSIQPSTSIALSPEAANGNADRVLSRTTVAPKNNSVRSSTRTAAKAASIAERYEASGRRTSSRRSEFARGDNTVSRQPMTRKPVIMEEVPESPNAAEEPEIAEQAPTTPARDPAEQARTTNGGRHASAQVNVRSDEQQQAIEEAGSAAQPVVVDDEQQADQAYDINDEDDTNEEDAKVDEDNERLQASTADPHRLHGHWTLVRDIMREVAEHRGERPSIADKTVKMTLRDCKRVRTTIRATAIDASPDELEQIVSECRNVVSRAENLCSDTSPVPNRDDRGYHIFKFLLPALAKLPKAVAEAFERFDIEGAGRPQITMDHLLIVINLTYAVSTCGSNAYHAYTKLDGDNPVKRDVHTKIILPLRSLHDRLTEVYQDKVKVNQVREQTETLTRELEARKEKRQRTVERQKAEQRNRRKWKNMNNVRFDVGKNSSDLLKLEHLRSCPMALVETGDNGQPVLPDYLRKTVRTFNMREILALQEALIKHVDTSSPLQSDVFEKIMREHCRFGGELAERNTLEIVRQANDMASFLIQAHETKDTEPPQWVWKVPMWMEPKIYSAEETAT